MEINKRIAKILEESGLTASEFADEIAVQRSSISHIISGRNKPSLEFIIKVKNRFPDLNWDWIISGTGAMKQESIIPSPLSNDSKANTQSTPDLFTLIDEDYKNEIYTQENVSFENPSEFNASSLFLETEKINDSQRLENPRIDTPGHAAENKSTTEYNSHNQIKRIVFFFENGSFESYEP